MVKEEFDVVIIGAGFGGIHALHRLRSDHHVVLLEAGRGVGGTWFWNRYPGARCDLDSLMYSYTFSPELFEEWTWSERYATQPELEQYANWVVDKLELRSDIRLNTRVTSARFNEVTNTWVVTTQSGDEYRARFIVSAAGALSIPTLPAIDGIESFEGEILHTGQWPENTDHLDGQRVGVIGTGSSGVQVIPRLAPRVSHLVVFQRTPNFVVPNGRMASDPALTRERRESLAEWRETAFATPRGLPMEPPPYSGLDVTAEAAQTRLEQRWAEGGPMALPGAFTDVLTSPAVNEIVVDFVRTKIRQIVQDPETAATLGSMDYPYGARRVCIGTGYYETFNRDNVDLVDVRRNPIVRFTASGIELRDGQSIAMDAVVLATGFDALTGAMTRIDIRGRDDQSLRDLWHADGPNAHLGLMSAGFPNLFFINGPMSPSVLSNMLLGIEAQVEWISACISYLDANQIATIEPDPQSQLEWAQHVAEVASTSLFSKARSWYAGDNVEGKPRVFAVYIGGFDKYIRLCNESASAGYEGFLLGSRPLSAPLSDGRSAGIEVLG